MHTHICIGHGAHIHIRENMCVFFLRCMTLLNITHSKYSHPLQIFYFIFLKEMNSIPF